MTRHLALSQVLMFLFDPTQDIRFRKLCSGKTSDPQMMERAERLQRERAVRQETILTEAAQRVRRYAGLCRARNIPGHSLSWSPSSIAGRTFSTEPCCRRLALPVPKVGCAQ